MKKLLFILPLLASMQLFSCDQCLKILHSRQVEIEDLIKRQAQNADPNDSLAYEEGYYLDGWKQGLIDAQLILKDVQHGG